MRFTYLAICVFLFGSAITPAFSLDNPGKLFWQKDLSDGYRVAIATDKPMAVLFEADWCEHCAELRQDVWTSPEMAGFSDKLVFVRCNPEQDTRALALANDLGITQYPSLSFILPRDQKLIEVGTLVGALPAVDYLRRFTALYNEAQSRNSLSVAPVTLVETGHTSRFFAGSRPVPPVVVGVTPLVVTTKTTETPAVKIVTTTVTAAPEPAVRVPSATSTDLLKMLADSGYVVKVETTHPESQYAFETIRGGLNFTVYASFSRAHDKIWLYTILAQPLPPADALASSPLYKLVSSWDAGPVRFSIADNRLLLMTWFDNRYLSSVDVKRAVDELLTAAEANRGLWNHKEWTLHPLAGPVELPR